MAFKDFSTVDELISYLDKPFSRTGGRTKEERYVYHYTCVDSLIKIYESRTLLLSRPIMQNDQHEIKMFDKSAWNGIYTASFVQDQEESVAMWSMYGKNWSCAIKIGFNAEALEKAVQQYDLFDLDDRSKSLRVSNIKRSVGFSSVAYKTDSTIRCGTVYNDRILPKKSLDLLPNNCAGYIKDSIWDYEKEMRLIARIEDTDYLPEKVIIDLSSSEALWESMVITPSPLYQGDIKRDLAPSGIKQRQIQQNRFAGLIKIESSCSSVNCSLIKHSAGKS